MEAIFKELLTKIIVDEFKDRIIKMNMQQCYPPRLCSFFDVDWETSQLKAIAEDLDIKDFQASISGGALVRTLTKQDLFKGDIDIFAHSKEAKVKLLAEFKKQKTFSRSKHAWNFEYQSGMRKTKVQLIDREEPLTLEETLNRFDFEHCKFGWQPCTNHLVFSMGAPITLAQKRLVLAFIRDPAYSMGRAIKYKRQGYDADKALEYLAALVIKGYKDYECDKIARLTTDATGEIDLELTLKHGDS